MANEDVWCFFSVDYEASNLEGGVFTTIELAREQLERCKRAHLSDYKKSRGFEWKLNPDYADVWEISDLTLSIAEVSVDELVYQ